MAGLHFDISGDDKDFLKKLKESEEATEKFIDTVQEAGKEIEKALDKPSGNSTKKFIDDLVSSGASLGELSVQAKKTEEVISDLSKRWDIALSEMQEAQTAFESGDKNVTKEYVDTLEREFQRLDNILNAEKDNLGNLEKAYSDTIIRLDKEAKEVSASLDKSIPSDAVKVSSNDIIKSIESLEKKYISANQKFKASLDDGNVKDKIGAYRQYLDELSDIANKLRASLQYVGADSGSNPDMAKSYNVIKDLLSEVNYEITKEKKNIDSASASAQKQLTILTRMKNIREEMATLVNADGSVSKENLDKYNELRDKLAEVGMAYRKVQQEQKLLTTKGSAELAGVIQGITGIAGAFSAFQGIASLFVKDNEQLAAIQTKLQAAMSITMGLQAVSNTLHATSAFRISTVTKLTALWTSANNSLAKSLKMSNSAAQLFSLTIIGTLVTAAIAIVNAYKEWKTEQEAIKKSMAEMKNSAAASIAPLAVEVNKLSKEWSVLGDNMEQKEQFVRSNQDRFKTLGVEIRNVNDAESILNENKDKFIEAMHQRALAIAATELASQKYKEALEAQLIAEEKKEKIAGQSFIKNILFGPSHDDVENLLELNKQTDIYNKNINRSNKLVNDAITYDEQYTNSLKTIGVASTDTSKEIIKGTKAYYEYIRSERQKELDKMKNTDINSSEWKRIKKERDEAAKMLQKWDKTNFKQDDAAAKKAQKDARDLVELQNKLANDQIKYEQDRQQKLISAREDGFKKQMEQNHLNYQKELQQIKEFEQQKFKEQSEAIAKYGKDKLPGQLSTENINKQVEQMRKDTTSDWMSSMFSDIAKAGKAENDARLEYLKEYGSFEEKRLAIVEEYAEKRKKATGEWQKKLIDAEEQEALKSLNEAMIGKAALWTKLFEDADRHTSGFIENSIKEIQQLIDYYNKVEGATLPDGWTEEMFSDMVKDITDVNTLMERHKALRNELNQRNPFKQLIKGFKDLQNAGEDTEKQFTAVTDIIQGLNGASDIIGELGNAFGSVHGETGKVLSDISEILGKAASLAQTGAAIGGPIGAAIGGGIGLLSGLASVFGGSNSRDIYERNAEMYQRLISTMDKVISKQKELLDSMSGAEAVEQAKKSEELIKKQIESAQNLATQFLDSKPKSGGNRERVYIREAMRPYQQELAKYGVDINNPYSILGLSPETLATIREEIPQLWAEMNAEFVGYLDDIIEYGEAIGDISEKAQESLTGISFDSLKDGLDDLVKQYDLTFDDIQKSFEGHMSDAVLNFVKNKVLQDKLKKWYDDFAIAMSDDILTADEKSILQAEYERIVREANQAYKDAMAAAGIDISEEDTRSSEAKGFAQASQDSVDFMTGLLTVSVEHTRSINDNVIGILELIAAGRADYAGIIATCNSILQHTQNIDANTRELYGMREDISGLREDMNYIRIHGVELTK